jgi:hypothetical protein
VFLPWMAVVLLGGGHGGNVDRARVAEFGPAMLLVYCVLNVVLSPNERTVYFSPAEVQFLFAGPFTRREILAYKILLTLLVSLPVTLAMGAVVRIRDGWLPAVLLGLLMISVFMQLFTLALGLLASAAGAGLYSRGRKVTAAVLALLAAAVVFEAGRRADWQWAELATELVRTRAWQVVSYPLKAFFDLLVAEQLWPDLLVPLAISAGVNLALVVLILLLDRGYQEASAEGSARRYAALQRFRGRSVGAEAPGLARRVRWGLPSLPFLGGVGPVLWRQLTGAVRALGRLMLALLLIGSLLAVALAGSLAGESPRSMMAATFGILAWTSILITNLVPFDYRGDLDRIALLKTLPIVPWRLTVGQLLTPVLVLSLGQWLVLGALAVGWPDQWPVALACAAAVPLYNFVLIGIDNLLFLLFPVRVMASTPGDFQALGRNVLLSLGKVIGVGVTLTAAAIPGVIGYALSGSAAVGILSACPVLVAGCAALVPLVSLAFRRFDVGRDTPA